MAAIIGRSLVGLGSLVLLVVFVACNDGVQTRPVGFFKLGPEDELANLPETPMSELKLYVRHDGGGFSVMSTACTYDLSALSRVVTPEGVRWRSAFSASEYDEQGRVVHGPARGDLPFYKLTLSRDFYHGPVLSVFAKVGEEVPRSWRLKEVAVAAVPTVQ